MRSAVRSMKFSSSIVFSFSSHFAFVANDPLLLMCLRTSAAFGLVSGANAIGMSSCYLNIKYRIGVLRTPDTVSEATWK